MFCFDLLYPDEKKRQEGRRTGKVNEKLIRDLQLEELVANQIISQKEYEVLCSEIPFLPSDREVIVFRQEILKDLADNASFIRSYVDFCSSLRDNVPGKRVNIWESGEPVYKKLQEHVDILRINYLAVCSANLKAVFRSKTLAGLAEFVEGEECKTRLQEIIALLEAFLDAGAVSFTVKYTYGQVMESVKVQQLFPENRYVMKEKGILKRKTVDLEQLISAEGNLILRNNLNEIYAKTVVKLCDVASRLNGVFVSAFKRAEQDLMYYQAGIKILNLYRSLGVPVCVPGIKAGYEGHISCFNLYPVRLLARCSKSHVPGCSLEIQGNDYGNDKGRISIITGSNSGGKTTFLQALGTAQLFAQLGFCVPARSFQVCAAPYIGSLFANAEDICTIHGKLEQELVEIREAAEHLKAGSLILMNEIMSTTSEEEGTNLMAEVLRAFSRTHSNVIFVTHLSRLADLAQKGELLLEEGESAVNYVAVRRREEDGSVRKTYRIEAGRPDRNIYEEEFSKRLGL